MYIYVYIFCIFLSSVIIRHKTWYTTKIPAGVELGKIWYCMGFTHQTTGMHPKTLFIFAFLFYELFTVCYLSFNTAATWSQSINKSSAKCSVWTMETVSINFMLLYKLYCPFQIRFSNVMENDAEAVGPRLDRCTLLGADILIKKLEYYKDTACCSRYYPAQYELEGWFAEAVNVSSPVLLLPSQNTSLCLTTVWQRLSDWHFLNTFTSPQRYSGWLIDKFGHDKWRCVCMSFWSQVLSRWTSGWLFYPVGTNISNLYSSLQCFALNLERETCIYFEYWFFFILIIDIC